MVDFNTFANTTLLNQQIAQEISNKLLEGVRAKGQASLVVSGGRTPIGLFETLTQQVIPWEKVVITLADERWVDVNDAASNEKLVREYLLKNNARAATFIGLKTGDMTPFAGAATVEKALDVISRPFDVVVLGMGDDGHTASLFPGAENLLPALALDSGRVCMGMTPLTAPFDRITLTLPALLNSRQIYLHIVGENKRAVYQQALAGKSVDEMPIRAFLYQTQTPFATYWAA